MLQGSGKFERTGIGTDREAKESSNTAFSYLKANGKRISGTISTDNKDYIINYQDLRGMSSFQIIPYSSAEDAVFKALGVE